METLSKGRGGRGRGGQGRGRSGQDQDGITADSTSTLDRLSIPEHSNKRGSFVRAKTGGRGRHKASLDHKISAPVHPAVPMANILGGLNNSDSGLPFLEHGRSPDLFNSRPAIEDVLDLRSVDLSTVCGAFPPPPSVPGLNTGVCVSPPFFVEDQNQQGALSHHFIRTAEVCKVLFNCL
ncbi:hypothetical protein L7F22_063102 [Adiantum nelumboides]|nr:hypothetical protein [Adiantum nelumboides]